LLLVYIQWCKTKRDFLDIQQKNGRKVKPKLLILVIPR
jgi:hypothetical protein